MKNQFKILLGVSFLIPTLALAQVGGVGGGDQCKNEIEKHRAAIEGWIQRDEAKDLDFTKALIKGQTYESYKQRMLKFLNKGKVVVTCHLDPSRITDPTAQKIAQEEKVSYRSIAINGQPTTCINYENKKGISRIACNYDLIMNPNALGNPNFKNTHHEFASIAGVEQRASNPSDFSVSDQLGEFEHWITTKVLGPKVRVEPDPNAAPTLIEAQYVDLSGKYVPLTLNQNGNILTVFYSNKTYKTYTFTWNISRSAFISPKTYNSNYCIITKISDLELELKCKKNGQWIAANLYR